MPKCCIYCGKTEDLSESDIIPDALTNARILNRCVCRVEHNNKFSDKFESKVIEALAFITNELDIKSKKGKQYAAYDAVLTIDGIDYKTSMHGDSNIFDGRVLKSVDNSHMISAYEKIVKIAKDEKKVNPLDVNVLEIEKKVRINNEIFFDSALYRMVAKIAFEWYCLKNDVKENLPEFEEVIKYIIDEEGDSPVSIVQEKEIYKILNKTINIGSHVLIGYETTDGKLEVVVFLFGLLGYRVALAKKIPDNCQYNFLFIELRTDSSRREIIHRNREEADEVFWECLNPEKFNEAGTIGGMKILCPIDYQVPKIDVVLYPAILDLVRYFECENEDVNGPTEKTNSILFKQLENILQSSLLHKKSLKRFVKDTFVEGRERIVLNTKTRNKKAIMMLYCIFLVGKAAEELTDSSFQNLIKKEFDNVDEIMVTDDLEDQLKNKIVSTEDYSDILEQGAEIIRRWQ